MDKVKDLYDLPISRFNKLNESTEAKNKKNLFDKVLDRLLKETNITDSKITFPFAIFKQPELTGQGFVIIRFNLD